MSDDLDGCSFEELLDGQLKVVRQCLAYNQAIRRLHAAGLARNTLEDITAVPPQPFSSRRQAVDCPGAALRGRIQEGKPQAMHAQDVGASEQTTLVKIGSNSAKACVAVRSEPTPGKSADALAQAATPHTPPETQSKVASRGWAGRLAEPLISMNRSPSPPPERSVIAADSRRPQPVFPDVDSIKKYLQNTLDKAEYNVEDKYLEEGCWQAVARNNTFKHFTLFVIFLNTIWIAIDTDYNKHDLLIHAEWEFQVIENVFCMFFTFEILSRFMAFKHKADAFVDGWFVFDLALVALMVWETWVVTALYLIEGTTGSGPMQNASVLRALRLFRLMRASRVVRLLRSFPELMILVQAMLAAVRSVFGTMSLMVLIVYVFAILFTQLLAGTDLATDQFENVPMSMNTFLKHGVFPDQMALIQTFLDASWLYYVLFLFYLALSVMTIMNLLIGVLCDVVGAVAAVEKETLVVHEVKQKLMQAFPVFDSDRELRISGDEFRKLLQEPRACRVLDEVGVDVFALVDYADIIFADCEEGLSFGDFVNTVLQYRGDNSATVKDVVDVRKCIHKELQGLEARLQSQAKTP